MDTSEPFRQMADRIDHNKDSAFGGAYVIIPPGQDVPTIEVLVLDRQEDPTQFFKLLMEKVKAALDQIEEAQRRGLVYGR